MSCSPGCDAARASGSRTTYETFIQARLADYHEWRHPHTDHTIVGLELDDHGLVAVGSHEAEFVRDGGQVVTATYLECAAVRTDLQGADLTDVDPLDDDDRRVTLGRYLLEVLLSDIAERERALIVRAVVARENTRSLRLCARIGLTDERDGSGPAVCPTDWTNCRVTTATARASTHPGIGRRGGPGRISPAARGIEAGPRVARARAVERARRRARAGVSARRSRRSASRASLVATRSALAIRCRGGGLRVFADSSDRSAIGTDSVSVGRGWIGR